MASDNRLIIILAEEIRQTALTGDMFEVIELYERFANIEPSDAIPLFYESFGILEQAFDYCFNYGEEGRRVHMFDPTKRKQRDLEEDESTMEFGL